MYSKHWEKIGQHFPSICYILHLTCFKCNHKISPTLQTNIRSILSSSPMGMGPSSLELPNQLILQTGHRNAEAKTAPWTPNATQRLQVDLLLRLANSTSLVPTWHGAQPRRTRKPEMVHLIRSPLQFTKQQPKVWKDQDPGTMQPEGNLTPLYFQLLSAISETCMVQCVRTCKNVYGRPCKTCTVEHVAQVFCSNTCLFTLKSVKWVRWNVYCRTNITQSCSSACSFNLKWMNECGGGAHTYL